VSEYFGDVGDIAQNAVVQSQICTTREAPCATWPHQVKVCVVDQEHVHFIEF
jgi:hypothetical protein